MSSEDHVSIEGTHLMLDNTTPHVAVPVQAIRDGKMIATVLSDEHGAYQFIGLKPGQYGLRCQVLGGYIYYRATDRALHHTPYDSQPAEPSVSRDLADMLQVEYGKILEGIDFHFAAFKKGTWKNYTYLDGLADNDVQAIHRDANGMLWFGTWGGGVSRYDGRTFANLTTEDGLVNNSVWCIYDDPSGVLWFGTNGGVSRYDGRSFVNLTTADGLPNNYVTCIQADPHGAIWFGTRGGVSRYNGKGFISITTEDGLVHNRVHAIHCDANGTMWFGTRGGISRYDGREFINLTTEDGLAHNFVNCIHADPHGTMWFGTEGGASRYDGREFISFTAKDGLMDDNVWAIHQDPDGAMWFATFGGGVSRYDGKGFVNFAAADGFANNVQVIHRDEDGILWFGTKDLGVFRYDEKEFISFTTEDGLGDNDVTSVSCASDGAMWFGTYGGVTRYDGKDFVNFTKEDGLAHDWVSDVYCDSNGILWFGTFGGVSRYDGKEFVNLKPGDGLEIASVYVDPDGVLWFGTAGNGLSRYDGETIASFTSVNGLPIYHVSAVRRCPDGKLWFGTLGSGIVVYDGKEFVNLTTEDSLAGDIVSTIHCDSDGVMWVGTYGGLSRYDGRKFENFTTKDGLVHSKVTAVYTTPDGLMCLGTFGGGVAIYDGAAWTSLDTRDGLANNVVQGICSDTNGNLWFATQGGITRYKRSIKVPQAHIVSVTTDRAYTDLDTVPAFPVGTRITIEYGSIDYRTIPEKRQYRCCIYEAGGNKQAPSLPHAPAPAYLPPTKDTIFDWIPEKPGMYIFEVQAIDRDLNYSEPATVSLNIQPDPKLDSMQTELSYLRSEVGRKYQFENIIGNSAVIMQVRALMEKAIESRLAVLITGETGTGKELVAKAIHHNSPRKENPLLALNCGAIPKELLASELFGHCRGAFTGAREDKIGLFEAASGGTLILDEISEMPEDAQIHLLRVLEERVVQRLGEHISRDVDVRVIAITNQDLMREVSEGRFREDLYYRLSVFPIYIPSLRERSQDVPLLAEHFLQDVEKELNGFAPDVFEVLQSYSWPGNVRELRNAVHRAAALAEEKIQTYHFPPEITRGESLIQDAIASQSGYSETVKSFQRRFIEKVLRECQGNRHEAARRLQMNRSNLLRLMKKFGIS